MTIATRVQEKFLQLFVFSRLVIKSGKLFHVEIIKVVIEFAHTLTIFALVSGLQYSVCNFHITQGVQHDHFTCDGIVIVNQGW